MTLCKTSGHCYLVYVNCIAYDVVCVACNKFYQVRWFNICLMVNIDSMIGRFITSRTVLATKKILFI